MAALTHVERARFRTIQVTYSGWCSRLNMHLPDGVSEVNAMLIRRFGNDWTVEQSPPNNLRFDCFERAALYAASVKH